MKQTAKKIHPSMRREQNTDTAPILWGKHLLKSLLITGLTGIALIASLSLIAYFCPDPDALTQPLGLLAAALTAAIGGFVAVRIHGHGALLCGLLNGSCIMALMILVSLFFKSEAAGYSAGISCLLHAAFPILSVAGAYLGLKKPAVKKKKRR